MGILKKLSWYFKREKRNYFLGVFALFCVSLTHMVPPKIIGVIVDAIDKKTLTKSLLLQFLALLAVVALVEYLFRYIWRIFIWGGAFKLEKVMRSRLFHHFLKMDVAFYQNHRTGDLMAHATNDLQAIQNVAGQGILTLADSIMTGGGVILAMILFVDIRLTLLAVLPLPLLALVSRLLGTRIHEAFKYTQELFSEVNNKVQESITGIKVLKTFGQAEEDIQDFEECNKKVIKGFGKVNLYDSLFDPLIAIIVGLSYSLTILFGGRLVMNGEISLGQLVTFSSYITMLIWPMFAVGMLFNTLQRGNASYVRVEELLAKESAVIDRGNGELADKNKNFSIQVNQFQYPDAEYTALSDIHVELPSGKMLGIVGKTGSGKSSLLRLILREFDAYSGAIFYDGKNIKEYQMDSYLGGIGYVPQNHFLFSMSVLDNIRFANPQVTLEEVEEIAKIAAIHEDILRFPEKYDTMVGERGVSLSGGQKQRLSISRALLIDASLLILDDALSAVDAKTEEKILNNLKAKGREQTTIITAHRLSSVMHADEILVFDQGKIVERGTHESLILNNGWYAKMWAMQQIESSMEVES